MKLIKHFDAFLANKVNLRQSRIDLLDDRVTAVENYLSSGDNVVADNFLELIPQGSYAHRTIINPVQTNDEFDADVLLSMKEVEGWDAEDYVQQLYSVFRAEGGRYRDKVSRNKRCVKVDYANEFHIDVVPYLERHDEHYITNRETNEFEKTDPEGFNQWLDGKNRTANGHLVKVLRLLKFLRDHKNTFSVKSVILTILVGERVNDVLIWGDPDYYKDVPTTLKNVLNDLDNYLQNYPETPPLVADPSCPTEDFNHRIDPDQYKNFVTKVAYYSQKVTEAFEEKDVEESKRKWRAIFGDDFGTYDTTTKSALEAHKGRMGVKDTEETIEGRWGIPIQLDPKFKVRIGAQLQKKTGFRHYELGSHGNVVSRGRTINFRLSEVTVPAPFAVYWKVRNTGEEAIEADCIRGQVVEDDGTRTRSEPTTFRGSHFVECYIVKDGVCVAKDRHSVIIR
ncbi:SMODS domain-containing nucleotidyltransferase [Nocardia sp. CA-107356]|uniref:SMODS domain-containing nucleotidyltransferase n=1 Tax=Nocardia sp. CA-107356 TaxID=3239972 RepID=UPI003D9155D9